MSWKFWAAWALAAAMTLILCHEFWDAGYGYLIAAIGGLAAVVLGLLVEDRFD